MTSVIMLLGRVRAHALWVMARKVKETTLSSDLDLEIPLSAVVVPLRPGESEPLRFPTLQEQESILSYPGVYLLVTARISTI